MVNIPASAQCFSYSFSHSLTAHLDISHTGLEIKVTGKRQSKQKIGHDAAVQMHSLYGSANIASLSTHARDSRNPSGKQPVLFLSLSLSMGSPSSLGIARIYLPLSVLGISTSALLQEIQKKRMKRKRMTHKHKCSGFHKHILKENHYRI